jgi:hypothetical protein
MRPFDWAPLAERDPLPGDPEAIRDEAFSLRNMAAELTSQVETLRKIGAAGDDLGSGQYTEGLKHTALEIVDKLELVRDRYAKVSGNLFTWADELEEFQRATLPARDKALDAERMRQRDPHADVPNPGLFTYQTMPAGGLGAAPALDEAEQLLADARRDLQRVLDEAAGRDRYWGSQIGHAIDDKLTDGWRDHLHQLIEHHKGLVDGFTKTLGYVTTASALLTVAFPPLMPVTMGLTLANLAVHSVEFAGDDASLIDIGLDVVALVGFGLAMRTSAALDKTFVATRQMASEAAGREAAAAVWDGASDSLAGAAGKYAAQDIEEEVGRRALSEANDAAARVLTAPTKPVGFSGPSSRVQGQTRTSSLIPGACWRSIRKTPQYSERAPIWRRRPPRVRPGSCRPRLWTSTTSSRCSRHRSLLISGSTGPRVTTSGRNVS